MSAAWPAGLPVLQGSSRCFGGAHYPLDQCPLPWRSPPWQNGAFRKKDKEKRYLQKLLLLSPHVEQCKERTVWFLSLLTASCALHPRPPSHIHMNICILTYPLWMDCMFLFSSTACQPFEVYPLLEHTVQFLGSRIRLWPDSQASLCWGAVHCRLSPSLLALLWPWWALSLHCVGFAENVGAFSVRCPHLLMFASVAGDLFASTVQVSEGIRFGDCLNSVTEFL